MLIHNISAPVEAVKLHRECREEAALLLAPIDKLANKSGEEPWFMCSESNNVKAYSKLEYK